MARAARLIAGQYGVFQIGDRIPRTVPKEVLEQWMDPAIKGGPAVVDDAQYAIDTGADVEKALEGVEDEDPDEE